MTRYPAALSPSRTIIVLLFLACFISHLDAEELDSQCDRRCR
jgi:hypothetical protein